MASAALSQGRVQISWHPCVQESPEDVPETDSQADHADFHMQIACRWSSFDIYLYRDKNARVYAYICMCVVTMSHNSFKSRRKEAFVARVSVFVAAGIV